MHKCYSNIFHICKKLSTNEWYVVGALLQEWSQENFVLMNDMLGFPFKRTQGMISILTQKLAPT